jgi:outer membrane protein OmpA-like peptidoglycan-associated protein
MASSPFQSNASEAPVVRRWFVVGLIASLALHGIFAISSRFTMLPSFSTATERLVPRAFTVNRAEIDPKLLAGDDVEPIPEKITLQEPARKQPIPLKEESFAEAMREVRLKPDAPEVAKPILSEKPRVESGVVRATEALGQSVAKELEKDLAAVQQQLLSDAPPVGKQPLLRPGQLSDKLTGGGGAAESEASRVPGFSDLDDLLATSGGVLSGNEAPIFMPGGALFEFDRFDVKPEAVERLRKLARLIERNPSTTFSIEGHTDSFGTPEYNLWLSERRALAVRSELERLGIPTEKLQTRGFGSSRPIVQPEETGNDAASVEREQARQAPNRRVEIVISTPRRKGRMP